MQAKLEALARSNGDLSRQLEAVNAIKGRNHRKVDENAEFP
jgi:hypothetical protein